MSVLLNEYVLKLGWAFSLAIIMAVAFPIFVWIFDTLIADINLVKEVRHKNIAAAIVLAAAILGISLIIALVA